MNDIVCFLKTLTRVEPKITWQDVQYKLLMGCAYLTSLQTNMNIFEAMKLAKKELAPIFDNDKVSHDIMNRSEMEQLILYHLDKMKTKFNLSDFAIFT